ncbi:hypothetical protein BAUCODRAFT_518048 [Baudoinia panamericana UAMH 10762]|uniref:Uncharacterized protein n=1 Tax=Baudoinia panamericana (strain UAMH 10762) TaxID=717646 RepID=M2NAG1_BAUPA|nr:uncharacterized protein BAUCODRAFT_518048 [Baudoinia panamericana UAMH 10762]EMC96119.1 hypothetical protein BAUCODRAFT_518048 [Baudoinia panamericana UAMH 10762]
MSLTSLLYRSTVLRLTLMCSVYLMSSILPVITPSTSSSSSTGGDDGTNSCFYFFCCYFCFCYCFCFFFFFIGQGIGGWEPSKGVGILRLRLLAR